MEGCDSFNSSKVLGTEEGLSIHNKDHPESHEKRPRRMSNSAEPALRKPAFWKQGKVTQDGDATNTAAGSQVTRRMFDEQWYPRSN